MDRTLLTLSASCRSETFAGRLFDLEALAFLGRKKFVVGYFRYQRGYVLAEAARDLIPINILIFDCVMEKRCEDEVWVFRARRLRNE